MCTRRKLVEEHLRCARRNKYSRRQQGKSANVSADKANCLKTACIDESRQRPLQATTRLTTSTQSRPQKMRHKADSQKRLVKKRCKKRRSKCKNKIKEAPSIPFTVCFAADGRCVPCSGAFDEDCKINWRPLGHALRAACTLSPVRGAGGCSGFQRSQPKPSAPQSPAAFLDQQKVRVAAEPSYRANISYRSNNWKPAAQVVRTTRASRSKGGAVVTGLCTRNKLACPQAASNSNRGLEEACNPYIGLLYTKEETYKSCPQTWNTVNYRRAHGDRRVSSAWRAKQTTAKENQEFAWLINQLSSHYTYVNEDDAIKEYEMQNRMLQDLTSSTMYQEPYLENPLTWMSVLPTNVVNKYLRRYSD
uniref:ATP-dependent helicase/deoxyribonuclease subunit B n=1 Tax=Zeugodacus cucurbitae TaxID=28588 RepID=A0A0A1XL30_ZEUCU